MEKQLGETGVRGKGRVLQSHLTPKWKRGVHRETPNTFNYRLAFARLSLEHFALTDQKHHTLMSLSVCPSSVFLSSFFFLLQREVTLFSSDVLGPHTVLRCYCAYLEKANKAGDVIFLETHSLSSVHFLLTSWALSR